ncbi:MAG: uroporphyrinogen decarboxylase family protein [Planctomycetota bacterium]
MRELQAMEMHFTIEQRVSRFKAYYARKNSRPLLGFFVGSEYPVHRYMAARKLPGGRPLVPEEINCEDYLTDCDRLFEEHEQVGGDFIYSASAFWGIPWLEAALGCEIITDHSSGSIYSEPLRNFKGVQSLPDFDRWSGWMAKAVEFIDKMAEHSNGRWPIGTTRMRGISDLLSALYGADKFVFAMMERADEVQDICRKLTEFWIEFGKLQLEHIPLFSGGIGSFYYNMWAPAGTIWHQEDSAALLSPKLYDEFIRPYDEQIIAAFDGCIMHQHPTGFVPTEFYLNMDFTALELHIDHGGPGAEELYEIHCRILEKKPLLIWGDIQQKDLDWIFSKLPHRGLAVMTCVNGLAQSAEIWSRYIKEVGCKKDE